MGTFTPSDNAKPYSGKPGTPQFEKEIRIEVILPTYLSNKVISAMKKKPIPMKRWPII